MIYPYPLVRANRAIALVLINPLHPIESIVISETISTLGPLINPMLSKETICMLMSLYYFPLYGRLFVKKYFKKNQILYEAEVCLLMLFNFIMYIN